MPYLTRTAKWFKFRFFWTNIITSNSGHETTAGLLAFCVLELGDHPDIEERWDSPHGTLMNLAFCDTLTVYETHLECPDFLIFQKKRCTIQVMATKQSFPLLPFIVSYKVILELYYKSVTQIKAVEQYLTIFATSFSLSFTMLFFESWKLDVAKTLFISRNVTQILQIRE